MYTHMYVRMRRVCTCVRIQWDIERPILNDTGEYLKNCVRYILKNDDLYMTLKNQFFRKLILPLFVPLQILLLFEILYFP